MEQQTDSAIFQAILLLKEHKENDDEERYRNMMSNIVESWEKQLTTYQYQQKAGQFSEQESLRVYNDLMKNRPSRRDYEIYRARNTKFIKGKSKEVRAAEELLRRVKNEINEVLN
jgi:major membrane immunogen (membrane-anchored lipoprotein)